MVEELKEFLPIGFFDSMTQFPHIHLRSSSASIYLTLRDFLVNPVLKRSALVCTSPVHTATSMARSSAAAYSSSLSRTLTSPAASRFTPCRRAT
ncbi:hypothetical protein BC938DRAFT_471932 [Jimgerdemannia flammicorona]|uniref:Uncharacterized protein n=1 Tax=Jimgerdemannia flammicorona TaxID=994334 RepID=A0A433Q727_9FUNG|nr:hypothetical protein BC938DRAFT_471932 [Jimgerdemannia flammicorona]